MLQPIVIDWHSLIGFRVCESDYTAMASTSATLSHEQTKVLWHTLTQTGQKIMSPFSSGALALDKCVGGLIRWARLMDMNQDAASSGVAVSAAMERTCLRLGSCMLTAIFGFAPQPWALAEVCLRKIRGAALVTVAPVILRGISGAPGLRPGAATRPESVKAAVLCFDQLDQVPDELRMAFALAADIATEGDATLDWTDASPEEIGEPDSLDRLVFVCRAVSRATGLSSTLQTTTGLPRLYRFAAQSAIALGNPYVIAWVYEACSSKIQPEELRRKLSAAVVGNGVTAVSERIDGLCIMCAFSESADRFSNLFERSLSDCHLELPGSAYDSGWAEAMMPMQPLRGSALPADIVRFAKTGFKEAPARAQPTDGAATALSETSRPNGAAGAAASSAEAEGGHQGDDSFATEEEVEDEAVDNEEEEHEMGDQGEKDEPDAIEEPDVAFGPAADDVAAGGAHELSIGSLGALSGAGESAGTSALLLAPSGPAYGAASDTLLSSPLGGLLRPIPIRTEPLANERPVGTGLMLPGIHVPADSAHGGAASAALGGSDPLLGLPGLSVSSLASTGLAAHGHPQTGSLDATDAKFGLGLSGLGHHGQPETVQASFQHHDMHSGPHDQTAAYASTGIDAAAHSLNRWNVPRPRVLDEATRVRVCEIVRSKAAQGAISRASGLAEPSPLVVICGGPLALQQVSELLPRFASAFLNGTGGVLIFGMTPTGDVLPQSEEFLTGVADGLNNCRALVEKLLQTQVCPTPPMKRWDAFWEPLLPADSITGQPAAALLGLRFLPTEPADVVEAQMLYFGASAVHTLGGTVSTPKAVPVSRLEELAEMFRVRLANAFRSGKAMHAPDAAPGTFRIGLI